MADVGPDGLIVERRRLREGLPAMDRLATSTSRWSGSNSTKTLVDCSKWYGIQYQRLVPRKLLDTARVSWLREILRRRLWSLPNSGSTRCVASNGVSWAGETH